MRKITIDELEKYINALRKCAKEHEDHKTFTGHIIVSDLCKDTANLLEELAQESSGDDVVSRDVVKEQMLKYGFHAPDMTVTEFVEDCLQPVNPKEPTTKNDLGVSSGLKNVSSIIDYNIPYTRTVREFEGIEINYPPEELCTYPEYKGKPYFGIKYKENGEEIVGYGTYNPEVLSQYLKDYFIPTTKNDLGVVCIDKTELLKAMDTWDKFGDDPNEGLIPLRTPALQNRYVPYVKYDDMVKCVKNLPSYYYDDGYCQHSSIDHLNPNMRSITMTKRIDLPTVGEILKEEFMDPYGISGYRLAKDIFVPVSRIQEY